MKIEATYSQRTGDITDSVTASVDLGLTEPITAEEMGEFADALCLAARARKTDAPVINVTVDGAKQSVKDIVASQGRQGPL